MSNKSSKKARSSAQILTEIAAITAGRKLKDLMLELSLANARELASAETPLKKARAPRPEGRREDTRRRRRGMSSASFAS